MHKNILIISPHFPPSNLAAVHRARLFAMHLESFGWRPVILTVHERFYEEKLDYNLEKLLPRGIKIEKVNAFAVTRPRLVGDIGLRGFLQMYRRAKAMIVAGQIEFVYILIPSFYSALLGRLLHNSTGVKYGIDYIDPWVHLFPGSDKKFSRHWWSTILAKLLEPVAVKKASLITGVAEGYYEGVVKRNPHLKKRAVFGGMPYGGEAADHLAVAGLQIKPYLFERKVGVTHFVYAGAMLPKAYAVLEKVFESIKANGHVFNKIEFHFIGTGKSSDDPQSFNIKPLAEKYGLWHTNVYEYPQRIPYLDVLVHLNSADAVFILGSTEPHYTPSKTYQAVLSGKPVLAVLHQQSSAVDVLRKSGAGVVLDFGGEHDLQTVSTNFTTTFKDFLTFANSYDPALINKQMFEAYSAKNVTKKLAALLEKACR